MKANCVQKGDLIAVYGLLRLGQSAYRKFQLDQSFEFIGSCFLDGQLFDMGGFPGLVAGQTSDQVRSDLFAVRDIAVIAPLDEFEDYWPRGEKPSRYERRLTKIHGSKHQSAWVYHCLLPVKQCPNVPDGDWVKWFHKHYASM